MLYISNTTKQHITFSFRTPDTNLLQFVEIPSGSQQAIGGRWSDADKAKVIDQLHRFGAHDGAEAYGRMDKFLGILYRDDAPISEDEIKLGHEAVVDTQERRSAAEATRAALGFDRTTNGGARGARRARSTGVEVAQMLAPHEAATGREVRFDMLVDPDGRASLPLPT